MAETTTRAHSDTTSSSSGSDIKVGLVTDTGGVDDKGFNQFSIAGLNEAKDKLGVQTRVYVSKTADDYQPNLTAASDDGNDLVISVGFLLSPSTISGREAVPGHQIRGRRPLLRQDGHGDARKAAQACACRTRSA